MIEILCIFLLFTGLIGLIVLFYYLHKRVESLIDHIATIKRETGILYENQQILQEDNKKLLIGLHNVEEKVNRIGE